MNIIFAGTPDFASIALKALIDAGHTISMVLTKPDAVSGRGMSLKPSAVKQLALEHYLRVEQPKSLKNSEAQELIRSVNADIMVVAAYGLILPQDILSIPRLGCLNIHGSILPRWRGAAPIQRAILAGDKETGITIIQMDAGLDTGDMLGIYKTPILPNDTTGTLYEKLAKQGGEAIVDVLNNLAAIIPVKQSSEGMLYAEKITKEEAKIDFEISGEKILLGIRAYNPFPGAFVLLDDVALKIWDAQFHYSEMYYKEEYGTIVEANSKKLWVAVKAGVLELKMVQIAGSKKMSYDSFVAGRPNLQGKILK